MAPAASILSGAAAGVRGGAGGAAGAALQWSPRPARAQGGHRARGSMPASRRDGQRRDPL